MMNETIADFGAIARWSSGRGDYGYPTANKLGRQRR